MSEGIGREFMEKTHYAQLGPSDHQRGVAPPALVKRYDPSLPRIELPRPEAAGLPPVDFLQLVTRRTSCRRYTAAPLSLSELSLLLWCTQGVKEVQQGFVTLRTVPSAGARHALETMLVAHRVEGLEPGLYGYEAPAHRLVRHPAPADLDDSVERACFGQDFLRASAVTFFWIAVPYRMTWRYGQRGYRYLHLDAGHVGQNLYLAAEAIGAGACTVAAFDDRLLNRLLGLDGQNELVIYLAAVGRRPAGASATLRPAGD